MQQYVDNNETFVSTNKKPFTMIDNYIYLYHTDTLIALPLYPDSIDDSYSVEYSGTSTLSSAAPIYSFAHSGPRQLGINLKLHRDMMNSINTENTSLKIDNLSDDDYLDVAIKQLQSMAVPRYRALERMVTPPIVAVRFGDDIFCKGIISGQVTVTKEAPILVNNKYAIVNVSFSVLETDPYDADTVMQLGSFRGLNTDLENRIHNSKEKLL